MLENIIYELLHIYQFIQICNSFNITENNKKTGHNTVSLIQKYEKMALFIPNNERNFSKYISILNNIIKNKINLSTISNIGI